MNLRARAGLRLVSWLAAVLLALALAGGAIGWMGLGSLTGYAILDAVLIAISLACWRWLDRRRIADSPLSAGRESATAFLRGAGVGALLVGVVVAGLALAGAYDFAPRSCRLEPLVRFLAGTMAFVVLAALFEEALFRGYGLFALRDLAGAATAVAVTGLLFALGHHANPGFGGMAVVHLGVVGIVLAGWILAEESVWVGVGAHVGWNAAIVLGAAIPVSGITFPAPCHAGILTGPAWLTGGTFGLEAGLPTLTVWSGLGLALWTRQRGRRGAARPRSPA